MDNYDIVIEGIFEKELYTNPPLIPVIVAKFIGTRKDIPRAFEATKELTPAAEMRHLRRIKNLDNGEIECIVCICDSQDEAKNKEAIINLEKNLKDQNIFKDYRLAHVPESAPRTNHQHKVCSLIWPCKFAKSNYLIQCVENSLFKEPERKIFKAIINSCLNFIEVKENRYTSAAVVFRGRKIFGTGLTSSKKSFDNPIQHVCMLAIDDVARNAGGGHWDTDPNCNVFLKSLQDEVSKCDEIKDDAIETSFLPYLCTNYDIFTTEQPCFMCVMALVQSRIRRLFYLDEDSLKMLKYETICYQDGAIENFHIHRTKNLNHRFEAWKIILKPKLE